MKVDYLPLQAVTKSHAAEITAAAMQVIESGQYLKGAATRAFERHYAEYIGTAHCVGCGNGFDALALILRAYIELGVMAEGDEVIVPANTFIASILAITANKLKPVLVEPDINTLLMDDARIEQAITPRTRAMMIVHLYGRCAYNERIVALCRQHHLKLIEDNAQAHGCTFKGRHTGSLGDAAGHSFYPGKNLGALGDAGAVTTDDASLAEMVRSLGNYGSQQKYVHDVLGRNSRIDELQAAVLNVKLNFLDSENQHRREIAATYIDKVENPLISIPGVSGDCVWHIFPVLTEKRDRLQTYLREHGVTTLVHYPIPPHRQKCCERQWKQLSLPVTELIHARELSLPCHPVMTQKEADYIVDLLNRFEG